MEARECAKNDLGGPTPRLRLASIVVTCARNGENAERRTLNLMQYESD